MSSQVSGDITNLNLIYTESYQYSLPKNILEGFLSGKAFDYPKVYTEDELKNLHDDINSLYKKILDENPIKKKTAFITAGAPGAGKTIKLQQELEKNRAEGKCYAYMCPDDVCLKNQTRTYVADIEKCGESIDQRKEAYNKWRPGSNAATHLILGNLIRENYAFYFGSTSSSPATYKFFEFLKNQGYTIKLIHVSASDNVRWRSIQERDKTFVQITEQDVIEKGALLPQRINDTFLKYADIIEFYYRNNVKEDTLLAARWLKNENGSRFKGTLEIIREANYKKIISVHNAAIEALNMDDLTWEKTVEAQSKIVYMY